MFFRSDLTKAWLAFVILFGASVANANDWDGRYFAELNFKMGAGSVCPSFLPVEIEIEVIGGQLTGFIFNNGGGNKHKFCKLYHNGEISGSVADDGKLSKVKIRQNDSHSRKYSSTALHGNITGQITLISKSAKYHPRHKFKLTKRNEASTETNASVENNKSQVEETNTAALTSNSKTKATPPAKPAANAGNTTASTIASTSTPNTSTSPVSARHIEWNFGEGISCSEC